MARGPVLGGIIIGAAQGWVVSPLIAKGWRWIPVTVAGWIIAWLILLMLELRDLNSSFVWPPVIGGVAVGLLQWLIIWRRSRRGWLWLLVSVIGTVVGIDLALVAALGVVFVFRGTSTAIVGAMCGFIAGGIYGISTALVLRTLLKSLPPQEPLPDG
jgi:hypothetical protein